LNPLISVIVPVYNVDNYIRRCLESLVNQTYKNLEIIIVNDGSNDNSEQICYEFAEQDTRVKVIKQENGGVSKARNTGLDIAKGEYIGFVDADDFVDIEMYEILLKNAVKYSAEISCCPLEKTKTLYPNSDRVPSRQLCILEGIDGIKAFLKQSLLGFNVVNKLFKKGILTHKFNISLRIAEDACFLFESVINSNRIVYTQETTYFYYMRDGSATKSGFDRRMLDTVVFSNYVFNVISKKYPQYLSYAYAFVFNQYFATLNLMIFYNCDKDFLKEKSNISNRMIDIVFNREKNIEIGKLKRILTLIYYVFPYFYRVIVKRYFMNKL
jgi:glycosyltransferase involved in cell wall biosynthesis